MTHNVRHRSEFSDKAQSHNRLMASQFQGWPGRGAMLLTGSQERISLWFCTQLLYTVQIFNRRYRHASCKQQITALCVQEGQWSELMLLLNSIPLFLGAFLVSIILQVKKFSRVFNVLLREGPQYVQASEKLYFNMPYLHTIFNAAWLRIGGLVNQFFIHVYLINSA